MAIHGRNSIHVARRDLETLNTILRRPGRSSAQVGIRETLRTGFTLLELLMVISIITILIAILIPGLTHARNKAKTTACGANLHYLANAVTMYLGDQSEKFWPYYIQNPDGRLWWFGFEPGGPGKGTNRPLDKSQAVMAPTMGTTDDRLQCPAFPYSHDHYYPKFATRSASYGYNLHLPGTRLSQYLTRFAEVFVFADGAHFDFGENINEGHYLLYTPGASAPSGYGHFRHRKRANVLYLDGHVTDQPLRGPAYRVAIAGQSGNLTDDAGTNAIYGL